MSSRYFEHRRRYTPKFWEITLRENEYEVRFGFVGRAGRCMVRTFDSHQLAKEAANRVMLEKHRQGYVFIDDRSRAGRSENKKRPRR